MLAATQASAKIGSGRDTVGVVTTPTLGVQTQEGSYVFSLIFIALKIISVLKRSHSRQSWDKCFKYFRSCQIQKCAHTEDRHGQIIKYQISQTNMLLFCLSTNHIIKQQKV